MTSGEEGIQQTPEEELLKQLEQVDRQIESVRAQLDETIDQLICAHSELGKHLRQIPEDASIGSSRKLVASR